MPRHLPNNTVPPDEGSQGYLRLESHRTKNRLRYSDRFNSEHVGVQREAAKLEEYKKQVTPDVMDFLKACQKDLADAPQNELTKAMHIALESRAVKLHLSKQVGPLKHAFPQMLYDHTLRHVYNQMKIGNERNAAMLYEVTDNPGHYELLSHFSQRVATFAKQCLNEHGDMLAPTPERGGAAR